MDNASFIKKNTLFMFNHEPREPTLSFQLQEIIFDIIFEYTH